LTLDMSIVYRLAYKLFVSAKQDAPKMTINLPKRPYATIITPLLIHIARKYHNRIQHPYFHFRLSQLLQCNHDVTVLRVVALVID
jgi:hypothetical protein